MALHSKQKFLISLGLSGLVPFLFLCLAPLFYPSSRWTYLLVTYSTVILSFLGGIHWGTALVGINQNLKYFYNLLSWSVLPALAGWVVLAIDHLNLQLDLLVTLFFVVWLVDLLLARHQIISLWFFKLRTVITSIVLVALLLTRVVAH